MSIKLKVTPKVEGKYSKEDITDHEAVAAIISKGTGDECKYLILDHIKHNMLTCVVGKVKHDQTIIEGLLMECSEEVGIKLTQYKEVVSFNALYERDSRTVRVHQHVFKIIEYTGTLRNIEPKKHRWIKWMTRKEVEASKRRVSDALKMYWEWLDDVNTPSLVRPNVTVGSGT